MMGVIVVKNTDIRDCFKCWNLMNLNKAVFYYRLILSVDFLLHFFWFYPVLHILKADIETET